MPRQHSCRAMYKFCSDHCIRIEMRVKRHFHRIWIAMEKLLVKRGPWAMLTQHLRYAWEQMSVRFESKYTNFIHTDVFEQIVYKMAAILSLPQDWIAAEKYWVIIKNSTHNVTGRWCPNQRYSNYLFDSFYKQGKAESWAILLWKTMGCKKSSMSLFQGKVYNLIAVDVKTWTITYTLHNTRKFINISVLISVYFC